MFTQEELKNILVLIGRSNITVNEAETVVELKKKLTGLLVQETHASAKKDKETAKA